MNFIHIADVHLGAVPDAGTPWSEKRKQEIWDTFRDIIDDARREQTDLLLIAGDLFHRPPTLEQIREVDYLFGTIPATRVVLIAGNHDHLGKESLLADYRWGENVACLFQTECECVRFPEIKTEVYGFSYDRQEIPEGRYDDLTAMKSGYRHILLAHGGDTRHIPINREKLDKSGFDYVALGHIHRPGELIPGKAVYSGAPEPIDCQDYGPHGYIKGTFHGRKPLLTFVPIARREYIMMELSCSEEDTTYSLMDRLGEQIAAQGSEHIYRVVLTGEHRIGSSFDTSRLRDMGHILEVRDETMAAMRLEQLRERYRGRLIGRYIDSFQTGKQGAVEEKALRYGLEALLGSVQEM